MSRSLIAAAVLSNLLLSVSEVPAATLCQRIRMLLDRRYATCTMHEAASPIASPDHDVESGNGQLSYPDGVGGEPSDAVAVQPSAPIDVPALPAPDPKAAGQVPTPTIPKEGALGPMSVGFDFSQHSPTTVSGDLAAPRHVFVHDYAFSGPGFVTGVAYLNDKEIEGPERPETIDLFILRPVRGGWEVVHRVTLPTDDRPPATDGQVEYMLPTPLVVEKGYAFGHWQSDPPGPIPLNLQEARVQGRSSGGAEFDRDDVGVGRVIPANRLSGQRDYFLNLRFQPSGSDLHVAQSDESILVPAEEDTLPPLPEADTPADPTHLPELSPFLPPATQDASRSQPVAQPRWDEAIELLELIDVNRDRVMGVWRLTDGKLESDKQFGTRIEIPYQPPDEYVLHAIAEPLDDPNTLILGQRVGGNRFQVMLHCNYGPDAAANALEDIDGQNFVHSDFVRRDLFRKGRPSSVVCVVRSGHVTVTCDGRELISWRGDTARLGPNDYWTTPHENALFLGTHGCRFRISRVSLTPITGTGKRLRPEARPVLDDLFGPSRR